MSEKTELKTLSLDEVEQLASKALEGAGTAPHAAASVARSTRLAERDGIRSHGLVYVPIYAQHVQCGKVIGDAIPKVTRSQAVVRVDAQHGFAHAAIDHGWEEFITAARTYGIASMTLHNSYNCGVLGHHVERIAKDNLLGLAFTHAPASIAPSGGHKPVIGTNPFAVGVPDGSGGVALKIDQSASVVAKSEILLRAREGQAIDPSWAFDQFGEPTEDAEAALKGSMAPAGGYKGFGVGLLVELMASCLAGALLSKDASPFAGTAGGPPATGQCFIAFDPQKFSGDLFYQRIEALLSAIREQPGAHVPGDKGKLSSQSTEVSGVEVNSALLSQIETFIA